MNDYLRDCLIKAAKELRAAQRDGTADEMLKASDYFYELLDQLPRKQEDSNA